jgi:quercetin dioxygenase-like cupin family protein
MHLEVDSLRQFVVSGISEPPGWSDETERQYQIAERASCGLARTYSDAGCAVVIDHCRNLPRLNALIASELAGYPVIRVLVLADLEVTLARNAARTNKAFDPRELEDILKHVHARYMEDLAHLGSQWIQVPGGEADLSEFPRHSEEPVHALPELDALIAAPEHHRLALENNHVRVLETRIEPGETTPIHTHSLPAALYVLSCDDFIRRDGAGEVMLDTRAQGLKLEPGQALWSGPLGPHSVENTGTLPIHIVSVEVKGT